MLSTLRVASDLIDQALKAPVTPGETRRLDWRRQCRPSEVGNRNRTRTRGCRGARRAAGSHTTEPARNLRATRSRQSTSRRVGGITSTLVAVNAITTVLNAYGMEADRASHVSDLLFQSVKGGKINFEQLA
ncbi:hypothetical protein LCGC14_1617750, partial [marine sediment metagenome]